MTKPNLSELIRTCPHLSQSVHRTEQNRGEENRKDEGKDYSPPPTPSLIQKEVWSILSGGLASLMLNDYGRPWPHPNRATIARLTEQFDPELCRKAAREAREIVQSQDRAPNISALFEKKLGELAAVRGEVRDSLEGAE